MQRIMVEKTPGLINPYFYYYFDIKTNPLLLFYETKEYNNYININSLAQHRHYKTD